MPFYPEGSYTDILAASGALQVQEAVRVGRAVTGALAGIHGQGRLHNEVVPSNVLRAGGTAVLSDFGATAEIGAPPPKLRTSSELVFHAPPEILRGTPHGPSPDVYQLASTLWTLLAGHPPFSDEGSPVDPRTYAQLAVRTPARPVPRSDVPRELNEVLLRALAKDPAERYPTPGAFEADLERTGMQQHASEAPAAQWPTGPRTAGPAASPPPAEPGTPATGPQAPPQDPNTTATSLRGGIRRRRPEPEPPAPPPSKPWPWESRSPDPGTPEPSGPGRAEQRPPAAASPPRPEATPPAGSSGLGSNPKDTIGLTADLVARLCGVTLNKDLFAQRGWFRLERWTGRANALSLPALESEKEDSREEWPDYSDLAPGRAPRWRRHLHIVAAVASIIVVAGATAVTAAVHPGPGLNGEGSQPLSVAAAADQEGEDGGGSGGSGGAEPEEQAGPDPSPASEEPPDVPEPGEVRLEDSLSSVQVRWTDNSGGTASYFVVGGIADHDPATLARTGPGAEVAQVTTDDTVAEYCFTVVAVDGGSASAPEVCTERAAARRGRTGTRGAGAGGRGGGRGRRGGGGGGVRIASSRGRWEPVALLFPSTAGPRRLPST
ncbi:serine/threonine-protein kinase [Allosalinactinospora lopnorensis]|uniref:serine/threonine-protein kinase n=1 Tax=Allosalinactinospora lopnorensis TaxID=1352348 RepID=UPI000B0142A2|nr:serine/threonine protein kinase [Allosalinactinospora lopnorensis]